MRAEKWRMVPLVLAVIIFHGCAGVYSVVDFEILEPANVNFPDYVRRLIIMDRAPVTLDAFEEEDRGEVTPDELYILDTIISYNLIRGVLEMFLQSPVERFNNPVIINEKRTDTTDMSDLFLTKREVANLCQKYGGDAIISLEFYSLDMDQTKLPDRSDENFLLTHYYTVSNEIHWNIYLPESPRPFDTYQTIDTIYFTDFLDGFFQPIPDGPGMIRELSLESGRKYGRYLVPVWTHASRQLYKAKGDSLKRASRYTDMGDWDSAFEIWKELLRSQDSTVVARAYHNMAIYYELEDQLDSANMLVGMALKYDTLETIQNYKEELETRLLNRKEILEQIE